MLKSAFIVCLISTAFAQNISTKDFALDEVARGGYAGGYGGGGYGNAGYGGGHSISMDPVSVLGLLSLGAVILRSILSVLTTSARSLDVSDINLSLQLSDIPEAITNWQNQMSTQHLVHERSLEDEPSALNTVLIYETLLRTEKRCIPHFLCTLWKSRATNEDGLVDIIFLATAGLLGETGSASIYDKLKKPRDNDTESYCRKAQASCPDQILTK